MAKVEGLIEGRNVHYVLGTTDGVKESVVGEHRAAIVSKVWNPESGMASLHVFVDGSNDWNKLSDELFLWAGSRLYSEDKEPGTWHFIERA